MRITDLVAEHFWLVLVLGLGAIILFIAFPVLAVLAVIAAIALGLITYSAKER